MLIIRLSRIGKKKKPMYRIIVSEKARDPYGQALEILGSYNPFSKDLDVKKDRIDHYLKNGAQMSPTVNNLLIENNLIKGKKVSASKKGQKKKDGNNEKEQSKEKKVPKESTTQNDPEKK